ncbi:hypothetical protein CF327_g5614 [Tilletia walkeri]|uniref:Carboxylic ester hydrolase n=1 Tax=Tilletia walkeri TaxID=117179 RepID=A0A8X7T2F7_9BASI|nr:hypothetical protein CF327_g5614 [Tilletia walkeri]KAE8266171.1 hypothetical protein A4X09_0g6169 [Tilletia walkeri]
MQRLLSILLLTFTLLTLTSARGIPNTTAALPPLRQDASSGVSYRTFQANDAQGAAFNVSTYAVAKSGGMAGGTKSVSGIYGWNFVWRGKAYDPSRPLMIWFGSSSSRCNDVSDLSCVLSKGLSEGWPKRIALYSPYTRTILTDANLAILNIVSPLCYNTTTLTPFLNACGVSQSLHALKHYRPDLVMGIMQDVQELFGFDDGKVVGSGASMGGRGILRLGTVSNLRAVSVTGANLETVRSRYMKPLPYTPWDSGEGCWSLKNPNVGGFKCSNNVQETLPLASRYANTPVQIYASMGDSIANLTQDVRPTCDAINKASSSSSTTRMARRSTTRSLNPPHLLLPRAVTPPASGCRIRQIGPSNYTAGPSSSTSTTTSAMPSPSSGSGSGSGSGAGNSSAFGPSHGVLMGWGYSIDDLNFLVRGFGGADVSFVPNRKW